MNNETNKQVRLLLIKIIPYFVYALSRKESSGSLYLGCIEVSLRVRLVCFILFLMKKARINFFCDETQNIYCLRASGFELKTVEM